MQGDTTRPWAAAGLVLGAMALFGLIDNFMRLAAETGGLWQFHFLRAVVALAILFPFAWVMGLRLWPRAPGRVFLRSVLNSVAMVNYFGCLGFMPIAQVVAGLFTAPIFVVIFSVLLFGERIGPRRVFAVLLGFAGIVLALRPEAGALTALSVLPVLAGAFYGLGNLVTRRWLGSEGTLTLLGSFFGMMMVWGALGCVVLALWPLPVAEGAAGWATRGWVPTEGIFLVMIVVQAVGSLIGVGMSIRAYQMADATMVSVFENTLLVFATVWAFVLWGEAPDALGLVGLGLITAAGVIIALRSPPVAEPQIAG
jgi:drug/metabolite transporter (DMT)-like permease